MGDQGGVADLGSGEAALIGGDWGSGDAEKIVLLGGGSHVGEGIAIEEARDCAGKGSQQAEPWAHIGMSHQKVSTF